MTVIIQIHYTSAGNRSYRRGEIQLRGKSKVYTALEFWKQIKKQQPYGGDLEKVLCEDEDITEAVKSLEKQEHSKAFYESDDLPF